MAWKWPHNIQVMVDDIKSAFPGIVVYGIGDAAHKLEHSDHNEDSRDIVHAADVMTLEWEQAHGFNGDDVGGFVLNWLLLPANRKSLQYLIHNGKIYHEDNDFVAEEYTGTDPHTNHVHISGKHGATGEDAGTGTGYSTAAEAMTPTGSPLDMEDDDLSDVMVPQPSNYASPGTLISLPAAISSVMKYNLDNRDYLLAVIKMLTDSAQVEAAIQAGLSSAGSTTDPAVIQAAFVAALRELFTPAPGDATQTPAAAA